MKKIIAALAFLLFACVAKADYTKVSFSCTIDQVIVSAKHQNVNDLDNRSGVRFMIDIKQVTNIDMKNALMELSKDDITFRLDIHEVAAKAMEISCSFPESKDQPSCAFNLKLERVLQSLKNTSETELYPDELTLSENR